MAKNFARGKKIGEKYLALRDQLWPDLRDDQLWLRKNRTGFVSIPRNMPMILDIMNDLEKGQPLGSTYFELWCRAFDECFVTLKAEEMAFHAGFGGQRAVRTWSQRITLLQKYGFIDVKPGKFGSLSYALIYNPYKVIKNLKATSVPIMESKYNALLERAIEIGADDLTEEEQVEPAKSPVANFDLDDEIPF